MTMTKDTKKWIAILSCVLAAVVLFGVLAKISVNNAGATGSTYVCPHDVVDWATDGTQDVELVKEDGQKVRLATYECVACYEKITIEQPIDAVLDNLPTSYTTPIEFVGNWDFGYVLKNTLEFTPYNSFSGEWMCIDENPWWSGRGGVSVSNGAIGMGDDFHDYVAYRYTAPKDGRISWYVADYSITDVQDRKPLPEAVIVFDGEYVTKYVTPIESDTDYFYEYFNNIQLDVKAGQHILFCFGKTGTPGVSDYERMWVNVAVSYMSDLPFEVNEYDAHRFGDCSHASYNWTSDGTDYEVFTAVNGEKYRLCTFKCDYCPRRITVEQKCDMSYDHFPTVDSDGELVNGSGNWMFGFTDKDTLEFTEYNTVVDGWATYDNESFHGAHGGVQLNTGYVGIGPDVDHMVTYCYVADRFGSLTWHAEDYEAEPDAGSGGAYPTLIVCLNGEEVTSMTPINNYYNFWLHFNNKQISVAPGMRVLFCYEEFAPGNEGADVIVNSTRVNVSISYMPENMNVREYNHEDIS